MALLKAVQTSFERIAPLALAGNWDNTGLLLSPPALPSTASKRTVLLTIDLTLDVLSAAPSDTGVIVSYHPPIFSGLKRINEDIALQKTLMLCTQKGIAVYSPHSALDGCVGGINDFLADGLGEGKKRRLVTRHVDGQDGAGEGMVLDLQEEVKVEELVERVKSHLGMKTVMLARSKQPTIKSIAICAGSGASMLKDVQADAWLTGEASHHELLAATARGINIILTNHSNTERPFLKHFAPRLAKELNAERENIGTDKEAYNVVVSEVDRDPLEFI